MNIKSNKLKINLIFLSISVVIILLLTASSSAYPFRTENPLNPGCHTTDATGVNITHNLTTFEYSRGESFEVEIQITGGPTDGYYVLFHPDQADNSFVEFSHAEKIKDNSVNDSNPADGEMSTIYTITLPNTNADLALDFFVIYADSDTHVKYSKVATFSIKVGQGGSVGNVIQFTGVVDHFSIYLGAPAIIALAVGTILYERDKEKYTKTHGILAATSLILTTINVVFIVIQPDLWLYVGFSNLIILTHIILGVVGYVGAVVAVITGISGIRIKSPGYTALICWSLNFLIGILQWGIRI